MFLVLVQVAVLSYSFVFPVGLVSYTADTAVIWCYIHKCPKGEVDIAVNTLAPVQSWTVKASTPVMKILVNCSSISDIQSCMSAMQASAWLPSVTYSLRFACGTDGRISEYPIHAINLSILLYIACPVAAVVLGLAITFCAACHCCCLMNLKSCCRYRAVRRKRSPDSSSSPLIRVSSKIFTQASNT